MTSWWRGSADERHPRRWLVMMTAVSSACSSLARARGAVEMADFATVAELETFMGTAGLGARTPPHWATPPRRSRLHRPGPRGDDRAARRNGRRTGAPSSGSPKPVTAVSAATVDAVAFTDFGWTRWGKVYLLDAAAIMTGPGPSSSRTTRATRRLRRDAGREGDRTQVAARAMGGPQGETLGTYGPRSRSYAGRRCPCSSPTKSSSGWTA